MPYLKILFRILLINVIFILPAYTQNTCPPNLDFENGDFTNWICKTGSVSAANNQNILVLNVSGQTTNRHTIIPYSDTTKDYYGGFPKLSHNCSGNNVKLGNYAQMARDKV